MNNRDNMAALRTLASKTKVGQVEADVIMMPMFIHLDACKRGAGLNNAANQLTKGTVMLMILGGLLKDRAMYNLGTEGYKALASACARPDPVSFTTGEYQAIRSVVRTLDRVVPHLEWKKMIGAHQHALATLKIDLAEPLYVD